MFLPDISPSALLLMFIVPSWIYRAASYEKKNNRSRFVGFVPGASLRSSTGVRVRVRHSVNERRSRPSSFGDFVARACAAQTPPPKRTNDTIIVSYNGKRSCCHYYCYYHLCYRTQYFHGYVKMLVMNFV